MVQTMIVELRTLIPLLRSQDEYLQGIWQLPSAHCRVRIEALVTHGGQIAPHGNSVGDDRQYISIDDQIA